MPRCKALTSGTVLCLALSAAWAEDKPGAANKPMKTKMMKDGMTTGDVRKAAEKKDREMKEMMEREKRNRSGGKIRK